MANCVANTPINHQYAITNYGDLSTDPFVVRFTAENFGLRRQVRTVKDEGTGSPWDIIGAEIESQYPVSGTISMVPRPDQMSILLPCLLGNAAATATTYKPAGVICDFFQIGHYDPTAGINTVFKYNDMVTNTWTLSASDSSPILKLDWAVEGATRATAAGATWPVLPLSIVQPWVFRQCVLTVGASTYRIKDIRISGNNNLSTGDFYNSAYRTELPTQKQDFMLTHTTPFDLAQDLALLSLAANVTAQVVFTSGANILTIDFPSLFARPEDPSIQGRQRVHNTIEWHAQYDPNVVGQTPIMFTNVP